MTAVKHTYATYSLGLIISPKEWLASCIIISAGEKLSNSIYSFQIPLLSQIKLKPDTQPFSGCHIYKIYKWTFNCFHVLRQFTGMGQILAADSHVEGCCRLFHPTLLVELPWPATHPPRITQKPPGSTWNDRQEKWLRGSYLCDCGLHSQEPIQGTAILVKVDFSWKLEWERKTGVTESTHHIPSGLPGWLRFAWPFMWYGKDHWGDFFFVVVPFYKFCHQTPPSHLQDPAEGWAQWSKIAQNHQKNSKKCKAQKNQQRGWVWNHWATFLHSF